METQQAVALEKISKILWCARIDMACDYWHLERRAVPDLAALAEQTGEPLLLQAIEPATKAYQLLDEVRRSLRLAIKLVERYSDRADEPEGGEDAGGDLAVEDGNPRNGELPTSAFG